MANLQGIQRYWAVAGLTVGGYLAGFLTAAAEGALIGTVAGAILAWALVRSAIADAIVGVIKGMFFVALIGPGADWLLSGQAMTHKLPLALVSGALLGGALGVKNARRPRKVPNTPASDPAESQSAGNVTA